MKLHEKYATLLKKEGITTHLRLCHFLTQIEHESGLKPISENLNYSAERLLQIFPKYFTTATAKIYARNPEKIANRVYANRMGNGDEKSGDGFKFRGRGFIQLTGKDNYTQLSKDTGVDYVSNPDLLLNEADAMISALWFWNKRGINKYADNDDIVGVRRKVNGGTIGLESCKAILHKYKKELL